MSERWYQTAVIYSAEVETYQDSNGDGWGDFPGFIARLDHLRRLGVDCLWLNPIHPSPGRDDGYDVTDYYDVHPRLGTLGDFAELVHEAGNRGIRVMIDLVLNHTSNEHPWFQEARSNPRSGKRDWYLWSESRPADRRAGVVFPGEQKDTWTYDKEAKSWYFHRFYDFEPELNHQNPEVRAEWKKILGFWLALGVSGFRMDAAPFVIELPQPGKAAAGRDFTILTELSDYVRYRRGDAVILGEANVDTDQLPQYFGDSGGSCNRLQMLFDFRVNASVILALAREDAEPVLRTLVSTPPIPPDAQWATFLRNHDEVDLSKLSEVERDAVFAAFAPKPGMRSYGRGIRRRLASMLGGDRRRIELAYSLQFTLPGTPVLRYGEEIGMGENLRLRERYALRTPMQWSADRNGGFSTAPSKRLVRPVTTDAEYRFDRVNVAAQKHDPSSLLGWFERMLRSFRECPEVGVGRCAPVQHDADHALLAHRFDAPSGTVLLLHNLGRRSATVDLSREAGLPKRWTDAFADRDYGDDDDLKRVRVGPYGYRWLRFGPR
jgi:maltose alpha-D-glucosyltransferase / alpha-amylase